MTISDGMLLLSINSIQISFTLIYIGCWLISSTNYSFFYSIRDEEIRRKSSIKIFENVELIKRLLKRDIAIKRKKKKRRRKAKNECSDSLKASLFIHIPRDAINFENRFEMINLPSESNSNSADLWILLDLSSSPSHLQRNTQSISRIEQEKCNTLSRINLEDCTIEGWKDKIRKRPPKRYAGVIVAWVWRKGKRGEEREREKGGNLINARARLKNGATSSRNRGEEKVEGRNGNAMVFAIFLKTVARIQLSKRLVGSLLAGEKFRS